MRVSLPKLEFSLSQPYPRNHLFLIGTVIVFAVVTPVLVLVNIPSLRPQFQRNDALASWWDSTRLPTLLRGPTPPCQPQDLGRGDAFRLSASLFDYTVTSTWDTREAASAPSQVQVQERVEYRGESLATCRVNSVRFDYNMIDDTQTVTVGVICPGTPAYPVHVTMETKIVFAWLLVGDVLGKYYGQGVSLLNVGYVDPTDYRRLAFAMLDAISTDSLTIMGGQHLSNTVLRITVISNITFTDGRIDNTPVSNSIRYLNGTAATWPPEANIYDVSILNLMNVVAHTVNLDLGSAGAESIYHNISALNMTIGTNLAPPPIVSAEWAENSRSLYFGRLIPPYETWAQMLRAGQPVTLGVVTGLPNDSTIVTTYLCPSYQLRPIRSFLIAIFVGTATMFMSGWTVWTFFMTWIAFGIEEPCLDCKCKKCKPVGGRELRVSEL
ncbi:hypothetical protein BDV93DRAFT_610105 [Ceratobasidium sp. AG-I]|nr:hypothetical protein BDV93DRAFT_610105 [Ceratobasidium sp. AG-I]